MPGGVGGAGGQKPWATRDGAGSIYVMTWGSGSCPNIPTSVDTGDATRVVIRTVEHDFFAGDDACTADLGVTTSVVRLPTEVNQANDLMLEVDGTTTRLTAR